MNDADASRRRSDDAPHPRPGHPAGAPVPVWALLLGMLVVPAVVLGLASTGSWLGVVGTAVVLAGVIAVLVEWSARW